MISLKNILMQINLKTELQKYAQHIADIARIADLMIAEIGIAILAGICQLNKEKKMKLEFYHEKNDNRQIAVPVDDSFCEMMNYAVRYALGRRTYAVSNVVCYVEDLVDILDDQTIYVMIQDIKTQREYGGLGMAMDEKCWYMLQQKLQLELNNRKATGKHGWKIEE